LLFIQVFRLGFNQKRSPPKDSAGTLEAQQSIDEREQHLLHQRALFREYLKDQKAKLEASPHQKRIIKTQRTALRNIQVSNALTRAMPKKSNSNKHGEESSQVSNEICSHSFGYLKTISDSLVPEDCIGCPKRVRCGNKNSVRASS
jgi:hypothetical protein